MPSPVAHGIAGSVIVFAAIRQGFVRPAWVFWTGSLAFAANAPDLDFVPGLLIGESGQFHHGPTHSLVAALVFGVIAWLSASVAGLGDRRRYGLLMGAGYLSHVMLDFLTIDTRPPFGMAILWPFVTQRLESPIQIFLEIWTAGRGSFWLSLFQWHNAWAIARELVIMGAMLAAIWGVSTVVRSRPGAAAAARK